MKYYPWLVRARVSALFNDECIDYHAHRTVLDVFHRRLPGEFDLCGDGT